MSLTPSNRDKIMTRAGAAKHDTKYSQNNSPVIKVTKIPKGTKGKPKPENDGTKSESSTTPSVNEVINSTTYSGYVCSMCQNIDSIRCSRLKLETDLLGDTTGKISELKSSLDNNISIIESFDLHIKHLLLNPTVFENYQSSVTKIQNMCSEIQNDIYVLNNSSSDNIDVTDNNNLHTINENISKTDNKISEIDNTLELISKNIDCIQNSIGAIITNNSSAPESHVLNDGVSTTPAPEHFISDHRENFISDEESINLYHFLSKQNYKYENGHSVINFGAPYKYNGAADVAPDSAEIPEEIVSIINKIKFSYPDTQINECLVNCYNADRDSHLSAHSDNEFIIDPESSIFCLSLGHDRTLVFRDKSSHIETNHTVQNRSLYVMTRSSQDFYTHEVKRDGLINGSVRYSLTFRHIGNQFKNSTIIFGDSNSKDFKFGDGKGTFGRSVPGKRIKAARVEDINPQDCAGYANIVIATGTNNLRGNNISCRADVEKVRQTLHNKLMCIENVRKDFKITVLPVLPTRYSEMNRQIGYYNRMLYEMFVTSGSYFNVTLPRVLEFVDIENLLRRDLVRTGDAIHLNERGISVFAQCIKKAILSRTDYLGSSRSYSHALTGGGDAT